MAQTANINININSKEAQANVDKLSQSINSAGSSSANLKIELRQITRELQGLEPGSARFQELTQRAGQLRDTIQDTNAVINATAGNVTENFGRALGNAAQLGVAGFQSVMAAQTLFGTQNEELNKALLRFGALLNLTQAIETFGGLGDKITQIKAGFMGLAQTLGIVTVAQQATAVSATEVAIAETAEAVAADGAAVSTGAFAVSLNALPLVAIVTAIGLLVAGLITYANSSSEAAAKEKKKNEELAKSKKVQEEYNARIKESSNLFAGQISGFISLTAQIKASLPGSKERLSLIKQSNATYGTTIKNLKDEKFFQDQVTKSVSDYIAFARVKFRLQSNEKAIEAEFSKQETTIAKLSGSLGILNTAQKQYIINFSRQVQAGKEVVGNLNLLDAGLFGQGKQFQILQNDVFDYLGSIRISNDVIQGYGSTINELNKEINTTSNALFKAADATNDHTPAIQNNIDLSNKYADALEKIKSEINRQIQAEEELEKTTTNRIDNTQEKEKQLLKDQYGDEKQKLIDGSIAREIAAFEEKFKAQGKSREDYDKGVAEIKAKGDANLLESEKKLLEEKKKFLEEDLKNIDNKYKLEEDITTQSITAIQDQIQLMDLEFQKQQEIIAITNGTLTEEAKQQAIIKVKKKYLDEEIKLIKTSGKDQLDALKLQKDKQLQNEGLTAVQRKEIETKYNLDVLKINQDTQNKIQDAIDGTKNVQKTALEDLQSTLETVSKYVDKAAEIFSQYSDLVSQRNEQNFDARRRQIEELSKIEKNTLDAQLKEGLISREDYDNKVIELENQKQAKEDQIAMESFNKSKKLQVANATIQGVQAVLSAYASGLATPLIGPAVAAIYAAIAGAFAVTQIAMIANQQFQAAEGGIVPGNGPGNIDSVPSLLAPGEFVINSRSSQMYPELLSNINESGGGRKLTPDLPPSNSQGIPSTVFQQDRTQQPIRAYVVEADVSSTQKRVDRIKRSVEF